MIVESNIGLQTSAVTWGLAMALLALWVLTLPLLVRLRDGWRGLLMSLRGLCWIAFGFGILFRFFLLAYDTVTFGDPSTRLTERPSTVVDLALINSCVYWLGFVAVARVPFLLPVPRLLETIVMRSVNVVRPSLIVPVTVIACVCVVASLLPGTPAALVTPFALVASMWVVPATILWVHRFSGAPVPWLTLVGTLAPGLLRVGLSPFREHILMILFVPLMAALFTNRRPRLTVVVPAAVALAFLSSAVIGAYRLVIWSEVTPYDAVAGLFAPQVQTPFGGPGSEMLRRFHMFDSLLLTVDLVPDIFPFTDRNLLLEGVTRGLIPRMVDSTKSESVGGRQFQSTIWSYDSDPTREEGSAAIAPSMPGSLYEAGGMAYVALGALLWGGFIATLDRLKTALLPPVAAAIHVLVAIQALAGIERDYAHSFATLLQTCLVGLAICLVVGRAVSDSNAPPDHGVPA